MRGRGEVPELALARSNRFVAVLCTPLVELPDSERASRAGVFCLPNVNRLGLYFMALPLWEMNVELLYNII